MDLLTKLVGKPGKHDDEDFLIAFVQFCDYLEEENSLGISDRAVAGMRHLAETGKFPNRSDYLVGHWLWGREGGRGTDPLHCLPFGVFERLCSADGADWCKGSPLVYFPSLEKALLAAAEEFGNVAR